MTAKADTNPLREALADIKSWRDDTLGKRPKERGEYDCAPEITEAFDRGARMAFYRCADRATAALASEPVAGTAFQRRVQDWMMECFSMEICRDTVERNHRFLEESLELVQSLGCTASEAHQLVDYVYGRPVGEPIQEVGGVMVTLAALCLAADLDMAAAGETELARVWTKIDKIRAKQAAKPKHSPLPESAPPAPAGRERRLEVEITKLIYENASISYFDGQSEVDNSDHLARLILAALPPQGRRAEPSIVEVASVIHEARFGPDYPEDLRNSFENEASTGRTYCIKLARAVLDGFRLSHRDATPPAPGAAAVRAKFDEEWADEIYATWARVEEVREECAKIVDAECERILSKQTATADPLSMMDTVNANLRMMACVLPDIAKSIREIPLNIPDPATPTPGAADRAAVIEEIAQDFENSVHHVWDSGEVADRIRSLAPANTGETGHG